MIQCPKCGHRWNDSLSPIIRTGMLPIEIEWAVLQIWELRMMMKYREADEMREKFKTVGVALEYGKDFICYRKEGEWMRHIISFKTEKERGNEDDRTREGDKTGEATKGGD